MSPPPLPQPPHQPPQLISHNHHPPPSHSSSSAAGEEDLDNGDHHHVKGEKSRQKSLLKKTKTSPTVTATGGLRRTVCDHCRRRRIRCDGQFPCNQCNNAALTCKREHVPKRRGPKKGSGRVINELRAQGSSIRQNQQLNQRPSQTHQLHAGDDLRGNIDELKSGREQDQNSQSTNSLLIDQWLLDSADASSSPTSGQPRWHPILANIDTQNAEPLGIFTTDQFRPTSPSYFSLIPTCIDLFYEHIYPIMPLIHMPTLREALSRPTAMFEKNLLYALCALTSTHMSGNNIHAPGLPYGSWEAAGRFFLDECILVRQSYDFVEDKSLWAVISSYLVHTAFFEINQNRKCWYYLRESMTMGQDLGLYDEKTYVCLDPAEQLCRRRTFWILYITERSYAILRHKPLTLSKTPELPTTTHDYEKPEIHTGFMRLVQSYHLLDSNFVDSWNEASEAPASKMTYTALQQQLNLPHPSHVSLTDIQKADILVTQQWLRLIVWQSSMRQGLLSSTAEDESMTFQYPLKIAHSLLNIISTLPTTSIEVHGMGIFEKIFEIGNTMLDVMQACGGAISREQHYAGVTRDPFQAFVSTLSQTPNSQRQYAALLLAKAAEKPEIQRYSQTLIPALTSGLPAEFAGSAAPGFSLGFDSSSPAAAAAAAMDMGMNMNMGVNMMGMEIPPHNVTGAAPFHTSDGLLAPVPSRVWRGSIVGEVVDEDGVYTMDTSEDEPGRDTSVAGDSASASGSGRVRPGTGSGTGTWTSEGRSSGVGVNSGIGHSGSEVAMADVWSTS